MSTPHTIEDQFKKIEGKSRQEQLANDQCDVDLTLGDDAPVDNSWSGNHARLMLPIEGDQ